MSAALETILDRAKAPISRTRKQKLSHEIFSINFVRRGFVPFSVRRFFVYLGFAYFGIQMLALITLIVTAAYANIRENQLRHAIQRELSPNIRMEEMKSEMDFLRQVAADRVVQLNKTNQMQNDHFFFASEFAAIAKTLPPRTWVTQLAGNRGNRSITLQASYLVDPQKPYQLPNKPWLDALKADPDFGRGLKSLVMTRTSQSNAGKAEICTFEFLAEWGEDKANAKKSR